MTPQQWHPDGDAAPSSALAKLSADPRVRPTLRASDADRDVVREVLNTAFTEGRLNHDELVGRLDSVNQAATVSDLAVLVDDVDVSTPTVPWAAPAVQPSGRRSPSARTVFGSTWLTVAIITNIVYLLTSISQGHLYYYWPMWPMFGMAIPMIIAVIFGRDADKTQRKSRDRQQRIGDRERRRLEP